MFRNRDLFIDRSTATSLNLIWSSDLKLWLFFLLVICSWFQLLFQMADET